MQKSLRIGNIYSVILLLFALFLLDFVNHKQVAGARGRARLTASAELHFMLPFLLMSIKIRLRVTECRKQ